MKTLQIGKYRRGIRDDITLNYSKVEASIIPSSASQHGPQYCIELSGGNGIATVYAATPTAHVALKQKLTANQENMRIVPGLMDILGVFYHHKAQGWPEETEGRVTRCGAPRHMIDSAIGKIPEKALRRYPFPEKPGIEVFGDVQFNNEMFYFSYASMERVTLQKNMVFVGFLKTKGADTQLFVKTANDVLAARLSASFGRRTMRRLAINSDVVAMTITLPSGKILRMGEYS